MRVQQSKLPLSWLQNSPDIISTIYSFMLVSPYLETLIDDGGLGTKVSTLSVNTLDDCGIAFIAKDRKTMLAGLRSVGSGGRCYNDAYKLQGTPGKFITGVIFSWDSGSTRRQSKAGAAIPTIAHNLKSKITKTDHLESVSGNIAKVSRDGLMVERGAIVFVCPSTTQGVAINHQAGKFKLHAIKHRCARELHVDHLADLISTAN